MTTPRDAIAGLSERLRLIANVGHGFIFEGRVYNGKEAEVCGQAATQLDALSARVKELEAHCRRLGQGGAERYWENRYRDEAAENEHLRNRIKNLIGD